MLYEFFPRDLSSESVPDSWSKYIRADANGLTVTGDRTAYRELYLHCGSERGAIATDLGDLLDWMHRNGLPTPLNPFSVSSLLNLGCIPLPHSEFQDVSFLSMGDTARVTEADGSLALELSHHYPWTSDLSKEDRRADEATLLQLLTRSTERQLAEAGNEGILMISSGKDSPAVALALAEGGFDDIRCVTYSSGPDDPEPPVARAICERLGLEHEVVEMPTDPAHVADTLTRFFEASARPGVDLSQIPYALAIAAAMPATGALIEGGGNDSYMGFPITGHDLTKMRFRIRGRQLVSLVQRLTPVDSKLNYLARSRSEATFPGRMLRHNETTRFYPDAVDTRPFWYEASRETRHHDLLDLFAVTSERHGEPGQTMQKQRLAAKANGLVPVLPWCDADIAGYYFNLPEPDRYDLKTGTSKILLRRMLYRYLDYDADAIGKHYFSFDGAAFIQSNMEFVRSEIDRCRLWDPAGLPMVHRWLDAIESRPFLYHSLLTIFMISGWHNHSRFLSDVDGSANGTDTESEQQGCLDSP